MAPEPGEQPLVRLTADRLEREGAVARPVEADRRDGRRGDGKLDAEVPDRRQRLRRRPDGCVARRGHRRERRGLGAPRRPTRPERGQEQGDDPQCGERRRDHEAARPPLGAAPSFTETGGLPGARRGHRGHGSAPGSRLHRPRGAPVVRPGPGLRSLHVGAAADPDPALGPAGRAPGRPPARVLPRPHARARHLSLPHRGRDRVHAQPAGPRPDAAPPPARSRRLDRVRRLRRGGDRAPRRARHRRRVGDPHRRGADRHVPHRGEPGDGPDGRRGRHRQAAGVARRPRARGHRHREAARRPHAVDRRR